MDENILRVLLIDDEKSLREPLAKWFRNESHFFVDVADSARAARQKIEEAREPYDVALIDDLLSPAPDAEPEYIGIELMRQIRAHTDATECIVFTGWGTGRAIEALKAGAYRYVTKPFDPNEMAMTIRMAAEHGRLRVERDLLSAALDISNAMVGEHNIENVLNVIVNAVPNLVGADACAVARIDAKSGSVSHEPVIPISDSGVKWGRHLKNKALTRDIVTAGAPYVLSDVAGLVDEVDDDLVKAGVRSFVGVPIPGKERNRGVLYVYSLQPNVFGEREQQLLTLLARQAGIAMENAELSSEREKIAKRLEALNASVLAIGSELDQHRLLESVMQQATTLMDAAGGGIYLLDSSGEFLTLETEVGLGLDIRGQQVPSKDGVSGWVLQTGEPQVVHNYQEWPGRLAALDKYNLKAVVGAPIRIANRILGTLVLHDTRPKKKFRDHDKVLVQELANHAALALERAQWAGKLAALQALARDINASLVPDEAVRSACMAAVKFFNADHSGMVQFDDDDSFGTVVAEYPDLGIMGKIIPIKGVPDEEKLIQTGEPIVVDDVAGRKPLKQVRNILSPYGIRSLLIVPVKDRKGRVLGSFSLDAIAKPRRFTDQEVELCKMFAAHVAVALEKARLFSDLAKVEQRQKALIESAFDAVIALNGDKKIETFNHQAEEMFGWTRGEMVGKTVARLWADIAKAQEVFELVSREGAVTDWPVDLRHRDGTAIPALLSASLIRDEKGGVIGQAGFMRDLRKVRQLEGRLHSLIQATRVITSTQDLQEVLEAVVHAARDAFPGADEGSIFLFDKARSALRIAATTYTRAEVKEAFSLRSGEGVAGWVFEQVQPTVVTDVERDPRFVRIEHPSVSRITSMICVPLRAREETIGALCLDNLRSTDAFHEDDLALLSTFAAQAGVAIENARLLAQFKGIRDAAKMVAGISTFENLERTLDSIAAAAKDIARCDAVTVYTYRQEADEIGHPPATAGLKQPLGVRRYGRVRTDSVVRKVLMLESPYVAENAREDQYMRGDFVKREKIRSSLGLPLKSGGRKVGVMFVNFRAPHHFTQDELAAIQLLADQAAVAIRNSQLQSATQKLYEGLLKAGQAAVEAGTLGDDALKAVADAVRDISEADIVSLYAYYQETNEITYPSVVAGELLKPEEQANWIAAKLSRRLSVNAMPPHAVIRHLLAAGRSVFAPDTSKEAILRDSPFVLREHVKSAAAILLKAGDRVVGFLFVNYRQYHDFTEQEKRILDTLATQAAIAFHIAQQYEEIKHTKGLVGARQALAWMGMASSAWRHAIDKHALTIREQLQLLRKDLDGAPNEHHARLPERLDMMERLAF